MDEAEDRKTYELALLLKSEDDAAHAVTWITQHNGEAVSEPRARKLALAYKINGNAEAVFVSVLFRALPKDAKQLERDLTMLAQVIRFMVLASPAQVERQPSIASAFPGMRRGRPSVSEQRPAPPRPLSNEALEKKIEEILQ